MISGTVSANLEPTIRLTVRGSARELEVFALIDTGFNGFLTLPSSVVATLALTRLGRSRILLADGREELFDIVEATVMWDGQPRSVETDVVDAEALVGMSLLRGHDLSVCAEQGGIVSIAAI